MIGEKHLHSTWLGGKFDGPALAAFNNQNTIRLASDRERDKPDGKDKAVARGLAQRTLDDKDEWKFGAWHPDICQFVMGDASVHSISNETSPEILRLLGCRNDGERLEFGEKDEEGTVRRATGATKAPKSK